MNYIWRFLVLNSVKTKYFKYDYIIEIEIKFSKIKHKLDFILYIIINYL